MAATMSASAPRITLRALSKASKSTNSSQIRATLPRTASLCQPSHLFSSCTHHPSTSFFRTFIYSPTPFISSFRSFSTAAKLPLPPTLNATLRKFYFLVHPDLFHSHPTQRAVNEQNMQHFLGFITAMKQTNSDQPWPLAQHTNLTFYVRRKANDKINTSLSFIQHNEQSTSTTTKSNTIKPPKRKPSPSATGGDFHVLQLTLSTNGGNCRSLVEKQLRHLFAMLGLQEEFRWDDEYWQTKPPIKRGSGEEEEKEDEYEYA